MARFYCDMQGNRGEATRMGSKDSGIRSHPRGWNLGIRVQGYAEGERDVFYVMLTGGSHGQMSERYLCNIGEEPDGRLRVCVDLLPEGSRVFYLDPKTGEMSTR